MFTLIKKLIKDIFTVETIKIKIDKVHEENIRDRILSVLESGNLNKILSDPITDIYILSVYSVTMSDLEYSLNSGSSPNILSAVSWCNYVRRFNSDIPSFLNKIYKHLSTKQIGSKVEHDLNEVLKMLETLGERNES